MLDKQDELLGKIQPDQLTTYLILIQSDGGSNSSVTNNVHNLHLSWGIPPYTIGGIGEGIVCSKKGIFHLKCDEKSGTLEF